MTHDVLEIANAFIKRAENEGRSLTNMQLQKLPYIAHGWWLAFTNEPLVSSNPYTWPYGPIFPRLYETLKIYGSGKVTSYIHENDPVFAPSLRGKEIKGQFSDRENKFLNKIWEQYGHMDGWKLSAITHKEGTPWCEVSNGGEKGYVEMTLETIRPYYKDLAATSSG